MLTKWPTLLQEVYLLLYTILITSLALACWFFHLFIIIIITFFCLTKCTEDEDDYMSCLPYVKHGASLSGSCFWIQIWSFYWKFSWYYLSEMHLISLRQWFGAMFWMGLLRLLMRTWLLSRMNFGVTRLKGGKQ